MQYKIPVQIENEDPIFMGLSLRQLGIMMVGGGIAYSIFQSLAKTLGPEIAFLPAGAIAVFAFLIAVFKVHEMTFVPFLLTTIRSNIFPSQRSWQQGTDSYSSLDIGYLTQSGPVKQSEIDMSDKIDTMQDLQDKLKKL